MLQWSGNEWAAFAVMACLLVAITAQAHVAQTTTIAQRDTRTALLEGVGRLPVTGLPGALCVFGDDAVAVVVGSSDGRPAVFAAASTLGRGRLVGLGHDGIFAARALHEPGASRFAINVVRWAAGGNARPHVVLSGFPALKPILEPAGFSVVEVKDDELPAALQKAGVAFVAADTIGDHLKEVESYVRRGGGLVTAIPGWGWQHLNPRKSLASDFGPNLLFSKAGIAWTMLTIDGQDRQFRLAEVTPPLLNISAALEFLIKQSDTDPDKLTREQKEQAMLAGERVLAAVRSIPEKDAIFLTRLRRAVAGVADRIPSEKRPVRAAQGLARVAIAMSTDKAMDLPPEQVKASPTATEFPGNVPDSAPRVRRSIEIDTAVPGWHSTGLYAPPGQLLRVTLPAAATTERLGVQIGSHTDQLWHLDEWMRMPQIVRSFPLDRESNRAVNAFGGLVYVLVPDGAKPGKVSIAIDQAVEAPLFVLGQTDIGEWCKTIRNRLAPWGELATDKLIITVPSKQLRSLDNPDELMRWWDKVLDAQADLATIPRDRNRPERVVVDVQISAGWLHAGYPIMGHMVHGREVVDLATLSSRGNWGFFHELGHNLQAPEWNFENTGEVTVNLFTLYCYDKLLPEVPAAERHPDVREEGMRKRLRDYRAGGQKFPNWDVFTALLMYRQLERGFGWDAYRKVFAEYRALPLSERPRTDDEKRDQWLVRFSRAVGRNLSPFFEWWSIPTSQSARDSVKDLPVWMPPELTEGVGASAGGQ